VSDVVAIFAGAGALAVAIVALFEARRRTGDASEPIRRMEARLGDLAAQLGGRIEDSTRAARGLTGLVDGRLRDAGRSLAEVQTQLARLDEATRQVESVGRSIAGLEKLLAAPKLRGGLGEWTLDGLLAEVLPADRILRQHTLSSPRHMPQAPPHRSSLGSSACRADS
jgi:DNA recombination protein RmuC